MAQYGPTTAWLLVGGNDVTGDVFDMQENAEQMIEETHPFLGGAIANWDTYLPVGMAKMTLDTGQGIYDTRTAGMLDAFQGAGQTRQLVNFGFAGATDPVAHVGAEAIMVDGTYAVGWTRKATRSNITMGQAKHAITGRRYAGKVIAGHTTRSGNGDTKTAYLDFGAGSYSAGIFDLSVSALSLGGGTNVVVKVQDSPDFSVWTDLTTFTAVTAAGSAERKTLAESINRYLSVTWTFTGGSAQTVKLCVACYIY